ncbi:MAG TPA: hypothetical protein VEE83_03740 [Thermoplasmata archaeon]|nr:hypothetical protein [Thermoplasmata archaeon]HYB77777.1 hypothetical protein [Thermoplasmata archaeon]
MNDPTGWDSVDAGLIARFRAAEGKIAWKEAPRRVKRPGKGRVRVAHLHDEEARVEVKGEGKKVRVAVDSGPLGALVLLLEIDRRGPRFLLGAAEAGNEPGFPSGAIVAAWGGESVPRDSVPTLFDLVELARYSLA